MKTIRKILWGLGAVLLGLWGLDLLPGNSSTLLLFGAESGEEAYVASGTPVPKGDRILGIDVNVAEDDNYDRAFEAARAAGNQVVSVSLNWDELETGPGKYNLRKLTILNVYLPPRRTKLDIFLRPADTNGMHLPKDLSKKRYDDPDVIARFNRLMDAILAAIPNLDVNFLSIGNEVDLGFANDKKLWKQYRVFYRGTKDFVKKRKPDWKVGIAMTLYGLTQQRKELAQTLNRHSDIILVSYYPINSDFTVKDPRVVGEEMGAVVKAYPHRTIYFSEAGYPSSPVLGSSEERQSEFVREVFKAWDAHASQIRYLAFSWLTDSSPAALDFFAKYYSLADNKFREYLRTLGLRTNPGHGTDKPAFVALNAEAKARGW